jgi:hypothetical protein
LKNASAGEPDPPKFFAETKGGIFYLIMHFTVSDPPPLLITVIVTGVDATFLKVLL